MDYIEKFLELLRYATDDGEKCGNIEFLIEYLEDSGFFTAPASTRNHLNKKGGLVEHSVNVAEICRTLAATLSDKGMDFIKSAVLCGLLHDVGKAGQFNEPLYVPNVLKSGKVSEATPWQINKHLQTLPHEVVSVIEIQKCITLTPAEQQAIAWHNGLYGAFRYDIQGHETDLYLILHMADMWASRITETKEVNNE